MESMLLLVALVVLAIPVLLLVVLVKLGNLKHRVRELENELDRLRAQRRPVQVGQAAPSRATQASAATTDQVVVESAVRAAPVMPSAAAMPAASVMPSAAATHAAPVMPDAAAMLAAPVVPATPAMPPAAAASAAEIAVPAMPAAPAESAAPAMAAIPAMPPAPAEHAARPEAPRVPSAPALRSEPPRPFAASASADPDPFERLAVVIKRWFTEGNVPVKVGVLVLLTGVAALLKYASDQGWLKVPIAMRLVAVALAALGALVFAWRKRTSHRSFALAVQGGSIGALLLVVYAAFKIYALLPAALAFALTVALVVALGVLALLQETRTLAVLGILTGFLAPLWLSTGSGNHVVLFSYYALLNGAIFALAWLRPWRELNLLGWTFTWGIGVAWGVRSYDPSKYATTQPFLLLFFAMYLLLPILHARWRAPGRRDVVDGFLLFSTPLVAFTVQAVLLEGERMPLALCALVLAVIYAALGWWQRRGPHPLLGESYRLLAAGFGTLSVPLALSAHATAAVFTVEGAALVWLGLRRERQLSRWAGTGLQLAAAVAFLIGTVAIGRPGPALANPVFSSALLLALAGFACAWWYRGARRSPAGIAYYCWGLAWWLGNAVAEIHAHVASGMRADVLLAVVAVTSLLAAEAFRRRPAPALGLALELTVLGAFVLAPALALAQVAIRGQPLEGWGAAAWLLFAACGVRSLVSLRDGGGRTVAWTQFASLLLWPLVFSLAIGDVARVLELASGWRLALPALPWLGLLAMVLFRWNVLRQPLGPGFDVTRPALLGTSLALIGLGWLRALLDAGDSVPLPWLPLLNPLDLMQLAALALSAFWLWSPLASAEFTRRRIALLSAAGIVLATCITLRTVHHWGGVPWGDGLLSASLAQTSLTVVWSVLGVAGWIAGSRRGQRALWRSGAVLMAVVLAKLVLVDRQHLGDLLGIGSFIAYGLMCTLVGWFAPAPPRAGPPEEADVAARN